MENTKKETKPTLEQQAAIDAQINTVVAAGAGSGKTTVLSKRFLNLIKTKGYKVDQILTLTFTKKATVEMSDRIFKVLKKDAPEEAANFYKANIKTLDSYCNTVAKLGCRFYGISPDFTQDDNAVFSAVSRQVIPFILKHRDNKAIKYFVDSQSYEKTALELFVYPVLNNSTVANPINFREQTAFQRKTAVEKWNKLIKKTEECINFFLDFENTFEGKKDSAFFKKYLATKNSYIEMEPVFLTEEIFKSCEFSCLESYAKMVCSLKFSAQYAPSCCQEYKEVLAEFRICLAEIPPLCNFILGTDFINCLIPLMEEFQQIVMDTKRSLNCLTFNDVSNMALCILKDYPEIRRQEKNKYKAIMIDEFQDNNKNQRDMLFLLAEKLERMEKSVPTVEELCPEKLFFVGDEKQSIYRFRGADVEVFNGLRNDFINGNLPMSTNHRSHPALIAAFNTIFGGYPFYENKQSDLKFPSVFFKEEDEQNSAEIPPYEAVYHKVTVPEYKSSIEVTEPKIHLAFYYKAQEEIPNTLTEESAEAEWVARKIKEKLQQGVKPSEIAVLMQKYTFQPLFERTFLRHGIPYNCETVKGFFSDGPVCDIIAFLQTAAYPDDTLAYAKVLRSPFVNLSMTETEAVLSLNLTPFNSEISSVLEGNALFRFNFASAFFADFLEKCRELSLTKLISWLWYQGGYRFETIWNHTVEMYGKLYDILFEMARRGEENNLTLSEFVDSVLLYQDENSKIDDMDIPLEKTDGVHIMSIHKSKGLEFEVVFVCNTHAGTGNNSNNEPTYTSRNYGLTFKTPPCSIFPDETHNYFFQIASDETKSMQSAEIRRLTYVALTRAKNELYITNGKYAPSKNKGMEFLLGGAGTIKSIANTLENIISFYSEEENQEFSPFTEIEEIPPYPRNETFELAGRKNTKTEKMIFATRLKTENPYEKVSAIIKKQPAQKKYLSPSTFYSEESISTAAEPNPELENIFNSHPDFKANNLGTIAHAYIEAAINKNQEEFPFSTKEILGLKNDEKAVRTVVEICKTMRDSFFESELGKKVETSTWHKAEYSFKLRLKEKIVSGIIDLVCKMPDENFMVIDFKTDREINPQIHYAQLACYKKALSQMKGIPPEKIHCFLFYLRHQKTVEITEQTENINLESFI